MTHTDLRTKIKQIIIQIEGASAQFNTKMLMIDKTEKTIAKQFHENLEHEIRQLSQENRALKAKIQVFTLSKVPSTS